MNYKGTVVDDDVKRRLRWAISFCTKQATTPSNRAVGQYTGCRSVVACVVRISRRPSDTTHGRRRITKTIATTTVIIIVIMVVTP